MKPTCELTGTNGNVFALASKVVKALKKAGLHKEATEFSKQLVTMQSYDAALQLMMQFVEVE